MARLDGRDLPLCCAGLIGYQSLRLAGDGERLGLYHMSDIPSFPYELLWEERVRRSVAHLTRRDGDEFLVLAPRVPVRTEVRACALEEANAVLDDLRAGRLRGAAVLTIVPAD